MQYLEIPQGSESGDVEARRPETCTHASRSYRSTSALLQLDAMLTNAKRVAGDLYLAKHLIRVVV